MSKEVEALKEEIRRLHQVIAQKGNNEAERTFKNIFDNSSDLIYIHDKNGIFIDINKAVIEKYGYSKDEIIGNTPALFSAPEGNDFKEVAKKIEVVWTGGPPQVMEWWSMKKDKTIFLKELILRKGNYFGIEVIIATGRDITERKEFENTLIQKNNELKQLNEALDAFVYSASHDLKAPLSSIKGLVNLLKYDTAQDTGEYLNKIELSVDKLISFLQDLVEYSRNARTELKVDKINMQEMIGNVFEHFDFIPEYKSVNRIVKVRDDFTFYSDAYRVEVILSNLISNAYRYHDPHKKDPFVKIKCVRHGKRITLVVEDNGIGIEEQHKDCIFNMFYRATDLKTGSGLGLYIVKETAQKLGAKITYSSEKNVGSRFEIQLTDEEV